MKKVLSFVVFFFISSMDMQPLRSSFDGKNNSLELVTEALELVSMIKKEPDNLFKDPEEELSTPTDQDDTPINNTEEKKETEDVKEAETIWFKEEPIEDVIKTLLKDINLITNNSLDAIKIYLNETVEKLNEENSNLDATIVKDEILHNLRQIYKLLFTGLQLNKGIFNAKKVFLRINYDQLKQVNKVAIEDIKNILTLLWVQYIEKYDNNIIEISFLRQNGLEQKQYSSPLQLAYFTDHSGNDFTENQLFSNYSRSYITAVFDTIQEQADLLQKEIDTVAQNEDLNKAELLKNTIQQLSNFYEHLFIKQQENKYFFQLLPELQDIFPTSKSSGFGQKPKLPIELAVTLAKLAEVWVKLIHHNIITKDEKISLTYPEILDTITKQTIKISAINWTHLTACAGYDGASKNIEYEKLIEPSGIIEDYKIWIAQLPQKTRGFFNKFSNWTSQKFTAASY